MSFTSGNDINNLQGTDLLNVGAGAGNDRYVLDAAILNANQKITITDTQGANTLQLVGGLVITSSLVANDALQLTLNNGAVITVLGASTFSFQTGGNGVNGTGGLVQNYTNFVTSSLGVTAGVPAAGVTPVTVGTKTVSDTGGTGPVAPTTPTFTITADAASAIEGTNATFTVKLSAAQTAATTVNFATTFTGNATAADITGSGAGTLTFAAGETTKTITLPVVLDALAETGEGVVVTLSNASAGTVLSATPTAATSLSDVPPPYTLTAASTSVNEGASATFNLVTNASEAGKTVAYTISGTVGAADIGGGVLTGTVVVGADGKATITVPVVADATTETDETLTVTLNGLAASASTTVKDTSVGPDASYYLLKTQDVATANKFFGSQTQFNVDGVGPTLNTGDFLTGTAGRTDNSLTVTDLTAGVANNNIPAGVTLVNIQNVVLNTSGNTAGGTGFSTVGYSSVRTLNGSSNGGLADLYGAKNGVDGTAVTVAHNGFGGATTVVGGTDVTVTTIGGNAVVGNSTTGTVPLATQIATGAVVVNQQNTAAGSVSVFGGTTVDVTTSSFSNTGAINIGNTVGNTGNNSAGVIANASGNVAVKTSGTGTVNVMGGNNVTVNNTALAAAGAITVGDLTYVDSSNLPKGNVVITEANKIAYNGLAGSANNNSLSGVIGVTGGKAVTITTNAANKISIGQVAVATKENALNPTGAVTVTNTGIETIAAAGAIQITGGTDVAVTTTGSNVSIGRNVSALIDQVSNPTGNVTVTETMNGAGFARVVTIDGGVDVTVNAKGQAINIGTAVASAPKGAVLVNQADMFTGNNSYLSATNAGNVVVDGGTTVTVNTTGGNVTVGGVVGAVNAVPSGAVAITRTTSGPSSDTTAVQGGTTVNIASIKTTGAITIGAASVALNTAGTALKDANLAPSGNVTIVNATTAGTATAYGTGAVNVNTNGATTVSIKGGDVVAINDIQATLATGGSSAGSAVGVSNLATVVIDGLQNNDGVAIKSDALTALSVLNTKGGANTVTITNNTAAHALTITQGGNNSKVFVNGAASISNAITAIDAKATSVTVTDNGTASTATLAVQAIKATSLAVNNAAAATIDVAGDAELATITLNGAGAVTLANVDTLSKVTLIDAGASTGTVKTSIQPTTVAGVNQTFKGGSGAATVTVTTNALTWGDSVLLTGGTGSNDVLVANYASAVGQTAMGSGTTSVKGFEFLGLGAAATSAGGGSYDAGGFSGVTLGAIANAVSITNAAKNASLSITATPDFAVSFAGSSAATSGTADGLTINVNTGTTANGINANTVTANGYEAISIVSNGATAGVAATSDAAAAAAVVNTMTLVDTGSAGTGTLTISGTGALTLTDATTRFSSMTSTNSKAVTLDAVTVSNTGAVMTGGAGAFKATGATGGTEVVQITLGSATASATPFNNNDTASAVIGGVAYTYTNVTGAAVSAAAMATGLQGVILAGFGAHGVASSVSGANIVLTKNLQFSATVFQATATGSGTVTSALVGGVQEQIIAITGNATATANTTINIANGKSVIVSSTIGDTPTQTATKLAAEINGIAAVSTALDGKDGVTTAVASGATVVLSGGSASNGVFTAAAFTAANNGVSAAVTLAAVNYATANDSFTTGSGGGTYTAGVGGSWNTLTHKYSSGSETVNLANSAAKVDVIKLADGRIVTNNGTSGSVNGFTVGSLSVSDSLNFATAGKTALANVTVATQVSAAAGAATMAAVLDPSGGLLTALGNLTYTISNGVITFSATGGNNLSQFTTAQLISAAEILVSSGATGANQVAVFSSGGNSYVVASDDADGVGVGTTSTLTAGLDTKNILVQLTGVASTTGFGTTGAAGAVVSDTVTNNASNAINTGSTAVATYNQAGFSVDTIVAAEFGTVSTSVTNLAPSAQLTLTGAGATTYQAVSVTQTGTAGMNSLTLNTTGALDTYKAINVSGDGLLALKPTGTTTITSLVDNGATNTLATIKVLAGGGGPLTVSGITDTALTSVDSSAANGAVTFGAAATAISNNGVTFKLALGQDSTIFASGSTDTFTQAEGAGIVTLTASGSANVITLGSTVAGNTITANGAGDTISVGSGGYTITATGAADTINIASGGLGVGVTSVTVGTNATVNIGTLNLANVGADTVGVTTAVTGGTSASFALTTINFVAGSTVFGNKIGFDATAADAFTLLGGGAGAGAHVNVAGATTLAQALDMAANYTALTQAQGATVASADLAANTGVVDWFQYGGDTYVVAMVNSTGAAVQQTALDANDIVVKITGMVDLSASTFAAEVFTV